MQLRPRRTWTSHLGPVVAAFTCLWPCLGATGVAVLVEGLDDEMKEAVLESVDIQQYADRTISRPRANYLLERGTEQLHRALEPFGYYRPEIRSTLEELGGGDYRATYHVDKGEPVLIRLVDVEAGVEGEVPEPLQRAVAGFPLETGDRFEHLQYERGKRAISTALHGTGFVDASLRTHRVEVNTDTRSADVHLAWSAGTRYRLGAVRFDPDAQFPPQFLRGYVPWNPGDYYSNEELLTLQKRLVDADYFSTVSVQPALDERADGVVPVDVLLEAAARNVYGAGLFYSTDFGAGGRLAYERRWLNRSGHKLESRLEYAQRLEDYGVTYRIPRPGPRNRDHAFGVAYRDEESDTVRSRSLQAAATETREQSNDFTRTLGLHITRGDFEIGTVPGNSTVLYGEASFGRLKYDDFEFPRDGHSLEIGLRASPGSWLSDTALVQGWINGRQLRKSGERDRYLLAARLGAMVVSEFDELPPELRFFAGGDRSLRGFDYQAIGEVNENGDVIGGKYLALASAGYEHYFNDTWGAAAFVDAGDAFSTHFDVNVSVGLGARWRSPIGMVRLDLAKPVVTRFDDGYRLHITIGPDL